MLIGIMWEQMGPEFGVELSAIDFAKFAECCRGKGYTIKNSNEIEQVIQKAMEENTKSVIVDAYVDPSESLLPPKMEQEFTKNIVQSFSKGQTYANRISLTLFRSQFKLDTKDNTKSKP